MSSIPDLISDPAHLNEDTMDHIDPVTGVANKGLSPGIHAVICLTVLIVIGH